MEWAVRLHPRAADPATACSAQDGPLQPPPQEPDISAEAGEDPLRGVRFGTLKAPGPTGLHPEHVAELLAVRQRRTARRLRCTLGLLLDAIASGSVLEEGRWLTYSRLIYLQKKRGELILDTPRPIKVVEVLRSAAAKRTLRKHEQALLPTLICMRQYGVSLPGGTEALRSALAGNRGGSRQGGRHTTGGDSGPRHEKLFQFRGLGRHQAFSAGAP